jgi:hypothetical protein
MDKVTQKLSRCFKKVKMLDNFGAHIQFRLNKTQNQTTVFGGCLFLLFLLYSTIYTSVNFHVFIKRSNMNLIWTNKITDPSPRVNLTEMNFGIALGLLYDDMIHSQTMILCIFSTFR